MERKRTTATAQQKTRPSGQQLLGAKVSALSSLNQCPEKDLAEQPASWTVHQQSDCYQRLHCPLIKWDCSVHTLLRFSAASFSLEHEHASNFMSITPTDDPLLSNLDETNNPHLESHRSACYTTNMQKNPWLPAISKRYFIRG